MSISLYQSLAQDYRNKRIKEAELIKIKNKLSKKPSKKLNEAVNVNISPDNNVNINIDNNTPVVAEPVEEPIEVASEEPKDKDEELLTEEPIEEAEDSVYSYSVEDIRKELEKAFEVTSGYEAKSADDTDFQDTLNNILKGVDHIESTTPIVMVAGYHSDPYPGFESGKVITVLEDGRKFVWDSNIDKEDNLPLVSAAECVISRELTEACNKEEDKKSIVKEDEDEEVISDEEVEEKVEEKVEEEPSIDTKEEGIDFLIKDEQDTIDGYKKVLDKLDSYELSDEDKELFIAKLNEIIVDEENHIEILKGLLEGKDIADTDEEAAVEGVPEEFEECEITSYKITRVAPKYNAYMLEAQTKDGLKYITGKNFNETDKTLDEAEIANSKLEASNRFKSFLK